MAISGLAVLLGFALSPGRALAQAIMLSPTDAINFTGSMHTVNIQIAGVTGTCADYGSCSGGSNPGANCKNNTDCTGGGTCTGEGGADGDEISCTTDASCGDSDDFCDLSGFPVGAVVQTGPNAGTTSGFLSSDVKGQASFTYTGAGGIGDDSIQGCLDIGADEPGDDATVADCINSAGGGDDFFASNTVTKQWTAPLVGTVVLSPVAAVNTDNPPPVTHTVTATVSGIARCIGGTND